MSNKYIIILISILINMSCNTQNEKQENSGIELGKTAIAIHGGAGNLKKLNLTPAEEEQFKLTLDSALQIGHQILENGGTAVDAVEATISVLENSPLFNAGKGAVFNHEGINELDAAIMNGENLECGAIAGVRHIKNPIQLAKKVMLKSEFVLLTGVGAEMFAQENGISLVDSMYFFTQHRWDQLQDAIQKEAVELDHDSEKKASLFDKLSREEKFGTVGCVALDKMGNIAAGTSTGGLTNKQYGRIGDSPIIGAGTYANNKTCAVSCTGKGEDFIRLNIAHDISGAMEYAGLSIDSAVNQAIYQKLKSVKGRGGCIALDRSGKIAMAFTTTGMYRGYINAQKEKYISIYEDQTQKPAVQ